MPSAVWVYPRLGSSGILLPRPPSDAAPWPIAPWNLGLPLNRSSTGTLHSYPGRPPFKAPVQPSTVFSAAWDTLALAECDRQAIVPFYTTTSLGSVSTSIDTYRIIYKSVCTSMPHVRLGFSLSFVARAPSCICTCASGLDELPS
jgi:hypothetical protein